MTIPKEIQENRIAWAKSDAQRDKGLTMQEDRGTVPARSPMQRMDWRRIR